MLQLNTTAWKLIEGWSCSFTHSWPRPYLGARGQHNVTHHSIAKTRYSNVCEIRSYEYRRVGLLSVCTREISYCILSFERFPGFWILCADVSEHFSIFIGGGWKRLSVPKRWGITQKKEHNIHDKGNVRNQISCLAVKVSLIIGLSKSLFTSLCPVSSFLVGCTKDSL